MKEITSYLRKLVSLETTTADIRENKKALVWIKNNIKGLPLYLKEFEYRKFPSLYISTKRTKKPKLLLAAHIDVVPGPKQVFKPRVDGGRLYGRGAFDMKYAVACYHRLLKNIGSSLPNYNFGVLLTTDEEQGGFCGTKYILAKGYRPNVCLLPDGGKNWHIIRKAKGIWQFAIKSYGRPAHSSKPWLGNSAVDELLEFLAALKKHFKKEPCKDRFHLHPTMNIGKINGGEVINQIADYAEAFIDIRFLTEKDQKRIKSLIKNIKKKYKNIKIENIVLENSFNADLNNKYIKIFSKIAENIYGIRKKTMITHGSCDARHFAQKNIPVIVLRPKGGDHHTLKEWIDLNDLYKFYGVLRKFVEQVGK